MPLECVSFKDTGYFSNLISDYLDQKHTLKSFYNRFPNISNFKAQIKEKELSFSEKNREVLVTALKKQYRSIGASKATENHINNLSKTTTFTITTGHQLNLFTGPLYFLYKIITTINLTEQLKNTYSNYNFVPIYWMATEDHDFLEINHFSLKGKSIAWSKEKGLKNENGYVGEFDTEGLDEVFEVLKNELGSGINASYLKDLFQKSYLNHNNLSQATRYIVNQLFGSHGLVIVDGNDKNLKALFIPTIKKELEFNSTFKSVSETTASLLESKYKAQVTPREINLFYGVKGFRERIVSNHEGKYTTVNNEYSWGSLKAILAEVNSNPERFSPNVLLRPVYQEVILPNLCYIGGGGELAYWFQLKKNFEDLNIPFPILLLRNSALLISKKQRQKIEKLSVEVQELFKEQSSLINLKVRQISDIPIDFSKQKKVLEIQFKELEALVKLTDKSFAGAVSAQKKKQFNGLNVLEKRLLKAQRIKLSDHVMRLVDIQNQLFPQYSLQERKLNFSEFYLEYGKDLIPKIKEELKPLYGKFNLIYM